MEHTQWVDARQIAGILERLEALPTLGTVAVRLLELTSSDDAAGREIVELISGDPSLASQVLKLCRCSEGGRAMDVRSVDRAVALMGLDAVRSAVLSVQIVAALRGHDQRAASAGERGAGGANDGAVPAVAAFHPSAFWRHALAVACAAETLARRGAGAVDPGEAFLAGLLHDLGQFALWATCGRAFESLCGLVDAHGLDLEQTSVRVMGVGPREAGRRLAMRWQLPSSLIDVIALQGLPPAAADASADADLVRVVTGADVMARQQHLCGGPAPPAPSSVGEPARRLGLTPAAWRAVAATLHDEVAQRAQALGLDTTPTLELLLDSISRANEALGRINLRLEQRNRALVAAQDELARGRTMAALGQIAAGAAHEMNNPLTVIAGRAQLLSARAADPELRTMAQEIDQQAQRLSDMITALREFSEPARPVMGPVDLATVVGEVVDEVRPRTPAGATLTLHAAVPMPPACADRRLIAQALRELIGNAQQVLGVSRIDVRAQTGGVDGRFMIQVENDGPGLSDEALQHAFEPFFSAQQAGRRPGLGLTRVQRIVEAHGGQVRLENRRPIGGPGGAGGGGAIATMLLPRWRGAPAEGTAIADNSALAPQRRVA